jgi:hypothetical protein
MGVSRSMSYIERLFILFKTWVLTHIAAQNISNVKNAFEYVKVGCF